MTNFENIIQKNVEPLINELVETVKKKGGDTLKKTAQFESGVKKEIKNSMNNFGDSVNNTIHEATHTNNDLTKQIQTILNKISTGISNTIEDNIVLSREALKCQTADHVINLQQKFFETNFSNMVNLSSDIGHCWQSMTFYFYENASACTDKNVKNFVH